MNSLFHWNLIFQDLTPFLSFSLLFQKHSDFLGRPLRDRPDPFTEETFEGEKE